MNILVQIVIILSLILPMQIYADIWDYNGCSDVYPKNEDIQNPASDQFKWRIKMKRFRDPGGTWFYEDKIVADHQEDDIYIFGLEWDQFSPCADYHNNCNPPYSQDLPHNFQCPPGYPYDNGNRCVNVTWSVKDPSGKISTNTLKYNYTSYNGDMLTAGAELNLIQRGEYEITARHHGWEDCHFESIPPGFDYIQLRVGKTITYKITVPRTQTTYYHPILKRNDGDPNDPNDRWFPIGSYFNVEADIRKGNFISPYNITDFAAQPYGHLYNMFNGIQHIDERGKKQSYDNDLVATSLDYTNMLQAGTVSTQNSDIEYFFYPSLIGKLEDPNLLSAYYPNWNNNTPPFDVFAMPSYDPIPYAEQEEIDSVKDVVQQLLNHTYKNRVMGWNLGDEIYGGNGASNANLTNPGLREHITDRVKNYIDDAIAVNDSYNHDGKNDTLHPRSLDIRAWGNFWAGEYDHVKTESGFTTEDPPRPFIDWLDDLYTHSDTGISNVDYIWDSSCYYNDVVRNDDTWQQAITFAESAMINLIEPGHAKGYMRFVQSWDFGEGDANEPFFTHSSELDSPGPPHYTEQIDFEKHRYLAYSSWVMGGQGLLFFRVDRQPTSKDWLTDGSDISGNTTSYGITNLLAEEAYVMKNWLMNEPATDIPAYIEDPSGNQRVRFILRRNQSVSNPDCQATFSLEG